MAENAQVPAPAAQARPIVGSISEFSSSKENWENYVRRLNSWLKVNKIEDGEKVDVMIAVIGPEAVELLVSLCAPDAIDDKTYTQLCDLMKTHFTSGKNELAESFAFDTRVQGPQESVSDYIVALKKLTIHSNFGNADQIKKRLRNRLVAGLRTDSIKSKLLGEGAGLTWDRAVEIATCMEGASEECKKMKSATSQPQQDVNRITSNSGNKKQHRGKVPGSKKVSVHREKTHSKCYRCDDDHRGPCPYGKARCYKCNRIGHIAKACKNPRSQRSRGGANTSSRQRQANASANHLLEESDSESLYEPLYAIKSNRNGDEYQVTIKVNNVDVVFVLDTASRYTIIDEELFNLHFKDVELEEPAASLKSYSGHPVPLIGRISVNVTYGSQSAKLQMLVAKGTRTALLGRDWLKSIRLDWEKVFSLSSLSLKELLQKYSKVFTGEIGEIKGFEAHIEMKCDTPKFFKARPVPYALVENVKKELEKLEQSGIISKVERNEWASPIVVVPKSNGKLRICGDYKVSINADMADQPYVLPTVDDLFATLAGGVKFTKLDLSQAYAQVKVEESAKRYLAINTVKGLYSVNRLPYGIKTAPQIFQSIMDQILHGIPGVCCYIDDILITGKSDEEHLHRLETVLKRLAEHNVKVNQEKCSFLAENVQYLGHVLTAAGRQPIPEKVSAIRNATEPKDVSELRTFLGMVNYYGAYLPDLATILSPLNRLLRNDVPWKWTKECQKSFESVKCSLTSDRVLTHYDPSQPLILACDASPDGVGVVLSHLLGQEEHPIAFASRTLTKAEKGYSQIEKEGLGIVYGVKKFHKYLYGRKFT
jgi:hypothetical protein